MLLVVQIPGSALILAAFAASQMGRTGGRSRSYLCADAIGSFALAASTLLVPQWDFLARRASGSPCRCSASAKAFPASFRRDGMDSSAKARQDGVRSTADRRQRTGGTWTP